ncbi:hypothetical protein PAPYR_4338 [Paratrimastix pyriformis]|uniref:Uncharacterized protein n=1 Tax=Paratrimastix pyriformis TaxID=342808 RepID=A0ABQ8UMC1_9EUKA|nr:hypothetical protein PAPYR_4338 [Paratrimastix pyriformis]
MLMIANNIYSHFLSPFKTQIFLLSSFFPAIAQHPPASRSCHLSFSGGESGQISPSHRAIANEAIGPGFLPLFDPKRAGSQVVNLGYDSNPSSLMLHAQPFASISYDPQSSQAFLPTEMAPADTTMVGTPPAQSPASGGSPMSIVTSEEQSDEPNEPERPRKKVERKKPRKWTEHEDLRLIIAVSKLGTSNWKRIATSVGGGRTGDQCSQHWHRVLAPDIRKGGWTEAEDNTLREQVRLHGKNSWTKVAKNIVGRTDIQCRYRWLRLTKMDAAGNVSPGCSPTTVEALE